MIQLAVPMNMKDADIVNSARDLIGKIKARQRRGQRFQSNPELFDRAIHLGVVGVEEHDQVVALDPNFEENNWVYLVYAPRVMSGTTESGVAYPETTPSGNAPNCSVP